MIHLKYGRVNTMKRVLTYILMTVFTVLLICVSLILFNNKTVNDNLFLFLLFMLILISAITNSLFKSPHRREIESKHNLFRNNFWDKKL